MSRQNLFNYVSIFIFATLVSLSHVYADPNGVLTLVKGQVEILIPAGKKPTGAGPFVKLEDEYFIYKLAKVGMKVTKGNVVRTGGDGKTRIVFTNGDNIAVGYSTSFKVDWKENAPESDSNNSTLAVAYGKLRTMVSKEGPRRGMNVKTPAAVAGVRGTDFYVAHKTTDNKSEVSVLRGSIEVKEASKPEQKPVKVETGFVVSVVKKEEVLAPTTPASKENSTKPADAIQTAAPVIELRKATQNELLEIQSVSSVKPTEVVKPADKETEKKVQELERKATETAVEDVKHYDKDLYEKIKSQNITSSQEVSTAVVAKLFKEAPKSPEKPSIDALEDIDDDVYDKYFKEK